MSHFDWMIVLWMVANTLHLPVPVVDGDNLKSGAAHQPVAVDRPFFDVDFVLLGCDPPDDTDDGPMDDDPESGSHSPFGPSFIGKHLKSSPDTNERRLSLASIVREFNMAVGSHVLDSQRPLLPPFSHHALSFGQLCGCGVAIQRC